MNAAIGPSEARPRSAVLLVDDQPAQLLALEAVLEPLGVDLVRASSGEAALEAARARDMAAILLDVRMPGMDGLETAARLRGDEATQSTPILFVSAGDNDEHYLRRYYRAGAVDYVAKPFDPEIVRAKVGVLVDLWERSENLRRRERELSAREHALAVAREKEARAAADTRASIRDMLVQSAPIGIAFIDRELRIETVNDALARMNRAPREAHIGRHVTEVSNLPISHEVIAILERVLETGEAATDLDFSWPEGPRTRHVRVSIFPIAPDGTVAGLGITVTDVTDQRAALAEAEQQRALLSATFSQAPIALTVLSGPEHVYELASPEYVRHFGLSPDIVGKTVREVFPEPILANREIFAIFDRVYVTGEPFVAHEYETLLDLRDGRGRTQAFLAFTVTPRRNADGEIDGIIVVAKDVTEQVLARRRVESLVLAHRESEARYRTLFESAAISLWEQDFSEPVRIIERLRAEGVEDVRAYFAAHPEELARAVGSLRTTDVNAETLRMLCARSKDELCPSPEHVFLPETHEAFARQLEAIADGEIDVTVETAIRTLTGERRDVVVRIRFPEEGEPFDRVPMSLVDITARKRGERALSLLAQTSVVLAESVHAGETLQRVAQLAVPAIADWMSISLRNDEDRIELVATAHVEGEDEPLIREHFERGRGRETSVCGHARALRECATQLVRELTPDAWAAAAADEAHLAVIERLEPRSHLTVPFSDERGVAGAIKLVYSRSGRRYDEEDRALAEELARRVSLAVERQRLFARAERERERAENANRAKDLFLSTLSHELRNPLNAILGWAQMLRMGDLGHDRLERASEVIERNAQAQAALIDDILDLSRITSGKLRLEVTDVDLVQVVEDALDAVRTAASAKQIRLGVHVEEAGQLRGDATRLQQVVWNLLSNAVKFTPPQGCVTVELRRVGRSAEITVTDTGAGIATEFVDQVFDTFRQEDASSSRRHGGLGLGLAIAKHIVELHGGTIAASSEGPGKGATFTVTLPISMERRITPLPFAAYDTEKRAFPRPAELRGLDVLVVEDEEDAREMLASMLLGCDARVTSVASVREALDALSRGPVDLVVSDIGMPGEDGYSLIRRLRSLPDESLRRVPAVALTAYASRADRTRALAEGFSAHVAKPVDVQELALVLASVVGHR